MPRVTKIPADLLDNACQATPADGCVEMRVARHDEIADTTLRRHPAAALAAVLTARSCGGRQILMSGVWGGSDDV